MNIKTIIENIETLACENMTEDGIHHDDWSDREWEYTEEIIKELGKHFEVEEVPGFVGTMEALSNLIIKK